MSSITYRIATGKHAGRKVATLQTIPADNGSLEGDAGKVGGFSLHAGVAAPKPDTRISAKTGHPEFAKTPRAILADVGLIPR